jgi:hypothetical protein
VINKGKSPEKENNFLEAAQHLDARTRSGSQVFQCPAALSAEATVALSASSLSMRKICPRDVDQGPMFRVIQLVWPRGKSVS